MFEIQPTGWKAVPPFEIRKRTTNEYSIGSPTWPCPCRCDGECVRREKRDLDQHDPGSPSSGSATGCAADPAVGSGPGRHAHRADSLPGQLSDHVDWRLRGPRPGSAGYRAQRVQFFDSDPGDIDRWDARSSVVEITPGSSIAHSTLPGIRIRSSSQGNSRFAFFANSCPATPSGMANRTNSTDFRMVFHLGRRGILVGSRYLSKVAVRRQPFWSI